MVYAVYGRQVARGSDSSTSSAICLDNLQSLGLYSTGMCVCVPMEAAFHA